MAELSCRKPCVYLYLIGIALVTSFGVCFPMWRDSAGKLERHEVKITQMEKMQATLDQNTRSLERLTVSVEYLVRGLGMASKPKESRP